MLAPLAGTRPGLAPVISQAIALEDLAAPC
jgi:hypothetical protein